MVEPSEPDRVSPDDLLPEPADPVIEPLEERPEVAAAIEDDTTVPGLPVPAVPDDPDTPAFEAPA